MKPFSCPVCGQAMNVRPFKSQKRKGFVFECWGTEEVPHTLKMYLDNFRDDAPFLLMAQNSAGETPGRKARASALLERAKALSGGG